jgi:predicted nucleotidyltransferase
MRLRDKIEIIMNKKEIDFGRTVRKLKDFLSKRDDVVFAYLHGSFVQGEEFRDVDVAVFLGGRFLQSTDLVEYEISLSLQLEKELRLPADVKILNTAPLSFRYHATLGTLLLTRDESVRENYLNRTWSEYFDFLPLSRIYQEELTRA